MSDETNHDDDQPTASVAVAPAKVETTDIRREFNEILTKIRAGEGTPAMADRFRVLHAQIVADPKLKRPVSA